MGRASHEQLLTNPPLLLDGRELRICRDRRGQTGEGIDGLGEDDSDAELGGSVEDRGFESWQDSRPDSRVIGGVDTREYRLRADLLRGLADSFG